MQLNPPVLVVLSQAVAPRATLVKGAAAAMAGGGCGATAHAEEVPVNKPSRLEAGSNWPRYT